MSGKDVRRNAERARNIKIMSPEESAPPGLAAPARLEPPLYERVGGRRKLAILVRNFYSSLQIHPVLGPIFARHIVDWPTHYATLTNFWCLQTGGPSGYSGKLVAAHQPLGINAPTSRFGWINGGAVAICILMNRKRPR